MRKDMWVPLIFGLAGVAILISLGNWQTRRLGEKRVQLAEIDRRIAAAPVGLPSAPDPVVDKYLPVRAAGTLTGEQVVVLASLKQIGAIHRIISVLDTGERRVLVDRGYRSLLAHAGYLPTGTIKLTGNLHWPDETDSYTPEPEMKGGVWLYFARDVRAMADRLNTEPLLIVAREITPEDPQLTPLPVTSALIPNDHLEYAITWFLLSLVWAGMTAYLLWRIRQRTV